VRSLNQEPQNRSVKNESVPRRRHVPSGCHAGNPVSVIGIG